MYLLHELLPGFGSTAAHLENMDSLVIKLIEQGLPGIVLHGYQVFVRVDECHPVGKGTVPFATGGFGRVLTGPFPRILVGRPVVVADLTRPSVIIDKVKLVRDCLEGGVFLRCYRRVVLGLLGRGVVVNVQMIKAHHFVKGNPFPQTGFRVSKLHHVSATGVGFRGPRTGHEIVLFGLWRGTNGNVGPSTAVGQGREVMLFAKLTHQVVQRCRSHVGVTNVFLGKDMLVLPCGRTNGDNVDKDLGEIVHNVVFGNNQSLQVVRDGALEEELGQPKLDIVFSHLFKHGALALAPRHVFVIEFEFRKGLVDLIVVRGVELANEPGFLDGRFVHGAGNAESAVFFLDNGDGLEQGHLGFPVFHAVF